MRASSKSRGRNDGATGSSRESAMHALGLHALARGAAPRGRKGGVACAPRPRRVGNASSAARSSREKSGGRTPLTTTRPTAARAPSERAASSMVSVVGISSGSVTRTMAHVFAVLEERPRPLGVAPQEARRHDVEDDLRHAQHVEAVARRRRVEDHDVVLGRAVA